jgi:hypothetical protein
MSSSRARNSASGWGSAWAWASLGVGVRVADEDRRIPGSSVEHEGVCPVADGVK